MADDNQGSGQGPGQGQPIQEELFQQAVQPEPTQVPAPVPAPPPAEPSPAPEAAIPSWRLREEAEGRRAAESRAEQLERRLNEIAAHLQRNQKQPDFFENPDQATQALIMR